MPNLHALEMHIYTVVQKRHPFCRSYGARYENNE